VAELADALGSGLSSCKGVRVQVPPSAHSLSLDVGQFREKLAAMRVFFVATISNRIKPAQKHKNILFILYILLKQEKSARDLSNAIALTCRSLLWHSKVVGGKIKP
jgi:hypothetical protein